MNKIKTWILDQFGLVDAYKRIVELERVVIGNKEWIDRHEGNLMILHKNVKALDLELDILRKRSENRYVHGLYRTGCKTITNKSTPFS